jgi:hypothetical protein
MAQYCPYFRLSHEPAKELRKLPFKHIDGLLCVFLSEDHKPKVLNNKQLKACLLLLLPFKTLKHTPEEKFSVDLPICVNCTRHQKLKKRILCMMPHDCREGLRC